MANLSNEELIEIGKREIEKREKQKEYDRIYNGRKKWEAEQYKKFAESNGFEMPEYPEELR